MAAPDKKGKGGRPKHIYLNRGQEVLLDTIARAMGRSRIGIEPWRSQLIAKAVANYIEDCRQDPVLKAAIVEAEIELSSEETPIEVRGAGPHSPKVN
jgi:hypothetical protein